MEKEQQEEQRESVESFLCPSFSTYSSNNLHDIADQVTREDDNSRPQNDKNKNNANDEENDFEFVAFRKAADEVFFDGHASHVFPIFNRDLLTEGGGGGGKDSDVAAIRISFGKFLIGEEERGSDPSPAVSSASSSEVEDDLEAIPAGTYCVWTPKSVQASPSRCKKSNSTGSSSSSPSPSPASKRWNLLSLLRRSKSDGKESLVVLTPSSKKGAAKVENSKEQRGGGGSAGGNNAPPRVAGKKIPAAEKKKPVSAHEALYGRKREIRRRSYLPYREDLFGFGVSLNTIGRGSPLHF